MKKSNHPSTARALQAASVLLLISLTGAQGESAQWLRFTEAPGKTPLGASLLDPLGEPINQGKILYNARIRYEFADQDGLESANALTFRQHFGYETPRLHNFYALAEGEYNWVLNNGDFAGYPPPFNDGQTVIADPESFALNRLLLGYTSEPVSGWAGRQTINLGNQRYVGAVGWRQNNQTFDAVRLQADPLPDLTLDYTWSWQTNRIFGSKAPATPLRRLRTNNHFVNATYTGLTDQTVGAYGYLLNLRNLTALSSDTVGLYLDGSQAVATDYRILYRAEFAYQTDNSTTTGGGYDAWYGHLRTGVAREGYQIGIGFERLSGDGTQAFQTPLATLHAFNGWTDTFLTTPGDGLDDLYLWLSGPLVAGISGRVELHHFMAENTSATYGNEIGLVLNRSITPNLSGLVKASHYDSQLTGPGPASADKIKFWAQFDFRL